MEKLNQSKEHREQIEEAISWYNSVLGFRIESGHGMLFLWLSDSFDVYQYNFSFLRSYVSYALSLI